MPPHPEHGWTLDAQLAADCVLAGDLPLCRLLVLKDANYPWLVLVPRRAGLVELSDLGAPEQAVLMGEITRAGNALREITHCDKLNVAALGNVVSQLHAHVVARFRTDPAWPRPVWGAVPARPYPEEELGGLLARLRTALGLV